MAEFAALPGVTEAVADGNVLRLRVAGSIAPVIKAAARYDLADFVSREPTLEEIFLSEYSDHGGAGSPEAATAVRGAGD